MSSLLVHCHGENWKSPTRSFGRSGKAKRTFQGTKRTFSLSQMNNVELARTLSWRELEIANTEHQAKWKGKTHFSRNEKEECCTAVGRIIYRHRQDIMPLLKSRKNVVSLSLDNKKVCFCRPFVCLITQKKYSCGEKRREKIWNY